MVQIAGERGVGHDGRATWFCRQYGICGLHEKEGGFSAGKAHFFGMFCVIAAHAVDAVHRKAFGLAHHGYAGLGRRGKHKAHGSQQSKVRLQSVPRDRAPFAQVMLRK